MPPKKKSPWAKMQVSSTVKKKIKETGEKAAKPDTSVKSPWADMRATPEAKEKKPAEIEIDYESFEYDPDLGRDLNSGEIIERLRTLTRPRKRFGRGSDDLFNGILDSFKRKQD